MAASFAEIIFMVAIHCIYPLFVRSKLPEL